MKYRNLADFLAYVKARDPQQPEFHQAVEEVMESLWSFIAAHPQYAEAGLLERLVEPERAIQFRVAWTDDRNQTQVNRTPHTPMMVSTAGIREMPKPRR